MTETIASRARSSNLDANSLLRTKLFIPQVHNVQEQEALALTRRGEQIWEQLARAIQQRSPAENASAPTGQATPSARPGIGTLYLDRIAAFRVRLWLSHGDIAAASGWVQSRAWQLDGEISFFQEVSLIALARVLIAQGEPARALSLLVRLRTATEAVGRMKQALELLLLQALALHALGQQAEALHVLAQALAFAEPEGYIRTFVDEGPPLAALLCAILVHTSQPTYVATLLAAFPDGTVSIGMTAGAALGQVVPATLGRQSQIVDAIEPLSERELEVLQLMAQGYTNPEIGQQIYISGQTVKVHTRNIYGKLGVNSRREAVTKAKALGLLS